jgi:RNA polymerase sigma-70 factor (ECF subfamily)
MGHFAIGRAELASLYQRYGTTVFRRALQILGDEAAARDVCQDVFVQILRARPRWSPLSPIGWLYTATTNRCLNLMRSARRAQRALLQQPRPPEEMPALSLGLLLWELPERLHEVAVYYGIDQMSQEEIALVLGVSQKTVSNRVQELRAWLERAASPLELEAT